jgi:hypothetical protein
MNAHVPIPAVTATPAWFAELCDNRALLFADGVLDLHEAVDELEAYARLSGLNRRIGRNTVQPHGRGVRRRCSALQKL